MNGNNFSQIKEEWTEIVSGIDNIKGLYKGINEMATVVGYTMGAKGRTVILNDATYNKNDSTKDGVSVAKEMPTNFPSFLNHPLFQTVSPMLQSVSPSCSLSFMKL